MNETFRAIMSDVVLPVFAVALLVAAIVVVTSYVQKAAWRSAAVKRAQGYVNGIQSRQPEIAGYATCKRCERPCVGYVMRVPGQEPRVHWQHQAPPESSHRPQIAITTATTDQIVQKLIGEELR